MDKQCEWCGEDAGRYALCDACHAEWQTQTVKLPYFKEMGVENPSDPKGSTAHVRDIKDRRYHPTEKRLFYKSQEMPGRTYFFPKG